MSPFRPLRTVLRRSVPVLLAALGLGAVPAVARVHVFLGFGPPLWGPPPIYYPPPFYYPPPVIYAPPAPGPAALAQSCNAGAYVCPLLRPTPVGGHCSCPDNAGGRIDGRGA